MSIPRPEGFDDRSRGPETFQEYRERLLSHAREFGDARIVDDVAALQRSVIENIFKRNAAERDRAEELRQEELREQGQSRLRNGETVVVAHEFYSNLPGFAAYIGIRTAMGIWGVRKLGRYFGRDISRRQAYGLLVAANVVAHQVVPDRRAVPRHVFKKIDAFGKRLADRVA